MRVLKLVVCLVAVFGFSRLYAEPESDPSATVEAYYELLRSSDYVGVASMFDPTELSEFRGVLRVLEENPSESDQEFMKTVFGPDITAEKLKAMSDSEYFSTFLNLIFQQLQAANGFSFDGVEIIGSVNEGDEKAHVVIRQTVGLGENPVELLDVVPLTLVDGDWKLAMKGDIKGIAAALSASLQGQSNRPAVLP